MSTITLTQVICWRPALNDLYVPFFQRVSNDQLAIELDSGLIITFESGVFQQGNAEEVLLRTEIKKTLDSRLVASKKCLMYEALNNYVASCFAD